MSKASRPVLLVGGVPGNSAEEVFRTLSPILGDLALGFTDGEFGVRRFWIYFVLVNTWATHPDLTLIRPVIPAGGGLPEWLPRDYDTCQWYGAKPGVQKLSRIETLGYPREAVASYEVFCRLRDQGVIPRGVRFQQSLPFPDDAVRLFTNNARDMDLMVDAYVDVMKRDVAQLCKLIPHEDLIIQWDINWETVALEHGDHIPDAAPMQFKPNGDPMDRFLRYIGELNAQIPATVPVGMHLCYGDLHHKHFKDPANLATSVLMANKAQQSSSRPINYVQMAVPRHRSDDAYFEPLGDLKFGDGTVYAGLVHYTDGVEGSRKRLAAFKRHFSGPTGVATECGLGRRPADQSLAKLLEIHRAVAAAI
ncbi:MAG TPA: hypothetical protein VNM68_00475 [Candidatus Polarisedimenticolia bacterium]|nr:hypothetical protein [Candidatus Polarisedimenticolia bacterium]